MKTSDEINSRGGGQAVARPEALESESARDGTATAEQPSRLTRRIEAEAVTIARGAAGIVVAEHAELRTGLVGAVVSSKETVVERSFVRQMLAARSIQFSKAGAGAVIAGGDVRVAQGGAMAMLSLGQMDIQQGGACGLVAASASVGRGGVVGLAITPRLVMADGSRILVGPLGALGMVGGAVIGLLIGWLVGRVRG